VSMNKNPSLWIVILVAIVGLNLYDIVGPQQEAPSQGLVILNWILLVCGAAGLVGAVTQLVQQKKRESA
jgi:hypothetical protein